jgi:hypothetical protein
VDISLDKPSEYQCFQATRDGDKLSLDTRRSPTAEHARPAEIEAKSDANRGRYVHHRHHIRYTTDGVFQSRIESLSIIQKKRRGIPAKQSEEVLGRFAELTQLALFLQFDSRPPQFRRDRTSHSHNSHTKLSSPESRTTPGSTAQWPPI